MMKQFDFLNSFIEALFQKIEKRSELVSYISETLNIERDSASRRLNQKVFFSMEEIGVLSVNLGISLDSLLLRSSVHYVPFSVQFPMWLQSMDTLTEKIESDIRIVSSICDESAERGLIFTFPPVEFILPYKNLLKFSYFKWGYFFTNSSDFCNYSTWEVPEVLLKFSDKILDVYNKLEKIIYIWDVSVIWSLVKDITYFNSLSFMSQNDLKMIKKELHDMLSGLEKMITASDFGLIPSRTIEMYVSYVHIGANFSYYISKEKCYHTFYTYFTGASCNDDYQASMRLREWVYSMKRVCSLISGSGARERKLFFDEQHKIIDTINI